MIKNPVHLETFFVVEGFLRVEPERSILLAVLLTEENAVLLVEAWMQLTFMQDTFGAIAIREGGNYLSIRPTEMRMN